MEQWKDVVGYEGLYEVSNIGGIRNATSGYQLKVTPGIDGYPAVGLKLKKPYKFRVHRLVAIAFLGQPQTESEVCHNNGDKLDNRGCNLRWDTHANNVRDTASHGRVAFGEMLPQSKLKRSEVGLIKRLIKNGIKNRQIAKMFMVSRSNIRKIALFDTWKSVEAI